METLQVTKNPDFTGEMIYVGIDAHSKQWTVTVMTEHLEHKTFVQPPEGVTLGKYLKKNFPGGTYKSVYEAGFCGFSIHYELVSEGIDNIVINPADVPTTNKERKGKRDGVDSRKLCRGLRQGVLRGIHIPEKCEQEEKESMRLRKKLTGEINRYKNRIKGQLHLHGIRIPEEHLVGSESWSKGFMGWLDSVELDSEVGTFSFRILIEQLRNTVSVKKKLEKELVRLLSEEYREELKIIRSVPGIGLTAGLVFLSELGDTSRFHTADSLCCFVGLVPNTYGSGEKEHSGRMTCRKNVHVQTVLVQCAWTAARADPSLAKSYEDWRKRMGANKAIIRVARKLLIRIRHILLNKEPYRLMVE
jgi:transposase